MSIARNLLVNALVVTAVDCLHSRQVGRAVPWLTNHSGNIAPFAMDDPTPPAAAPIAAAAAANEPRPPNVVPLSLYLGRNHEYQYWCDFAVQGVLTMDAWYVVFTLIDVSDIIMVLPPLHKICSAGLMLVSLQVGGLTLARQHYAKWRPVYNIAIRLVRTEFGRIALQVAKSERDRRLGMFRTSAVTAVLMFSPVFGLQLPTLLQIPLQLWAVLRVTPVVSSVLSNTCLIPDMRAITPACLSFCFNFIHSCISSLTHFVSLRGMKERLSPDSAHGQACTAILLFNLALGFVLPVMIYHRWERRGKQRYLDHQHGRLPQNAPISAVQCLSLIYLAWWMLAVLWVMLVGRFDVCRIHTECPDPPVSSWVQ